MKKTLTVNLNGRIFHIDEDAYVLLDKYLSNLRIYFRKEEGADEIITDFEARIEELFSDYIRLGNEVITIEYTETVIKQVGKPEDFEIDNNQSEEKQEEFTTNQEELKAKRKFYRNIDNKIFGGVCSGIAAYFGWDPTFVRLASAILILISTGWMIPVYILMWAIIPAAKTVEEKLEMQGEKVNLENIGKMVSSEISNIGKSPEAKGCLTSFVEVAAVFLKIGIVLLGLLVGGPLLLALFILFIVLISVVFGVGSSLLAIFPFSVVGIGTESLLSANPIPMLITLILLIGIPVFSIIYGIVSYFTKLKPIPRAIKWVCSIAWIISLILFLWLGANIINEKAWKLGYKNVYVVDKWGSEVIKGNQTMSSRIEALPPFDILKLENGIWDIQLEIDTTKPAQITVEGESNIIDRFQWENRNGVLEVFIDEDVNLKPTSDVTIKLKASSLKGIEAESVGNFTILNKLNADDFYIDLEGVGNVRIDSLYCNSFRSEMKGVGNITVKGQTNTANLTAKGTAKINAVDFEAKEVDASVYGIGSIKCNPIKKLNATVKGLGSILYKNEPLTKNVTIEGLGKVSKD